MGVLVIRALLCGVDIRATDFWKLALNKGKPAAHNDRLCSMNHGLLWVISYSGPLFFVETPTGGGVPQRRAY